MCFDSQIGWKISPAADSDNFFPIKERAWQSSVPLLVKRESVCSLSKCLLCIYYLCLDFFSLCSYVFCTQGFSPSQQNAQLDPSDGTPKRDFWSLIISLPPPSTFPPCQAGWCDRGSSKDKSFISLQCLVPPHPAVGQRAPAAALFVAFPSLKSMTKMAGKSQVLLLLVSNKPWSVQWYITQWSNWVFQSTVCDF